MGYKNVKNATASCGNPPIDEKIEAVVVDVLLEKNLGYSFGSFGENKTVV